ncbi:MAG: RCC1 domain-containing protein [Sandaracinaceae bacterium]
MRRAPWLAVALVATLGCEGPRALEWTYRFASSADRDASTLVEASVREGGCDGEVLWRELFARADGATMRPPELGVGTYGVRVRARDAGCRWIADRCEEVTLPREAAVAITMESITPEDACTAGAACMAGECAGERDAGRPGTDAGPDAGGGADGSCAGCMTGGTCVDGDAMDACGRGGEACVSCTCGGDTCDAGRCVPRTPADRVSAAFGHTCAIAMGKLYCWGESNVFQVGAGFGSFPMPVRIGGATDWTDIEVAGLSSCGVHGGAMECWGANNYSQLGLGAGAPTNVETRMTIAGSRVWTSSDIGNQHGCGIDDAGAVLCWGSNLHGSVGSAASDPQRDPLVIDLGGTVTSACAGNFATCAVREGTLLCWGWDRSGELGDGTAGGSRPDPVAVDAAVTDWESVACGYAHMCGRTATGRTFCWGCGGTCPGCGFGGGEELECTGALGSGDTSPFIASPVEVSDLLTRQVDIETSACAIGMDDGLYCWGPNGSGELGVGDTDPRIVPAEVVPRSRWVHVATGRNYACAVRDGGAIYCWGANDDRQLGIGGTSPSLVPARVCLP